MHFQWYPGHMTKARRMMQENIKLIDIVVELVDARVPLSSKNPDIDELARNKYRLIVLNKADMADAKKIAVEAESAGQKAVEGDESLSQAELISVGAQSDALMEVKAGTADVAVIDAVMAYASVGEGTSYSDLAVVDGIELGKEEYGIGFRKGSNVVDEVNKALQELTEEGIVEELQAKYPSVLVTLGKDE